jgi:ABC-type multidrug transport system permease subunit
MENKQKHLEFIQNVITRMNTNSFLIKGWTITIVAALFALAAKDSNKEYTLIPFIVIPVFWVLDGFFISQERQYRGLYDHVRILDDTKIDFNMNASEYNHGRNTWLSGIFSFTLILLYFILIFLSIVIKCLIINQL